MKIKKLETKTQQTEVNTLAVNFEIKQLDIKAEDPDYFYFEGIASMYGVVDHADDIVQYGAFTKSLQTITPVILWQHQRSEPIGIIEELNDSVSGLYIRVKLPRADTLVSGRVIPQIKVGGVRKLSIGWITEEAHYDNDGVRVITKGTLLEVSVVTIPANDHANITGFKNRSTKLNVDDLSFLDAVENMNVKTLEKALCESKFFSNDAAKKLAGCVSRVSRDVETVDDKTASDAKAKEDEAEALAEIKSMAQSLENHAIQLELSKINNLFGATK